VAVVRTTGASGARRLLESTGLVEVGTALRAGGTSVCWTLARGGAAATDAMLPVSEKSDTSLPEKAGKLSSLRSESDADADSSGAADDSRGEYICSSF
jgi:hypothetical protein